MLVGIVGNGKISMIKIPELSNLNFDFKYYHLNYFNTTNTTNLLRVFSSS